MKCPWCWKRITLLKEVRRPGAMPDHAMDALNICSGCHRFSFFVVAGTVIRLRKPTADEAARDRALQQTALALPRGAITPDSVEQVMRELLWPPETKH